MDGEIHSPSARTLIGHALRKLARPPFAVLTAIGLLLWGVSLSISALDETGLASVIVLTIVSAYVRIAAMLAAVEPEAVPSADLWLRSAVARRCFWRFTFAELFSVTLVVLGAVLFIVPSFLVGAAVALATPAAVFERLLPVDAVRRSLRLTGGHRLATGLVFGLLVWGPMLIVMLGYELGWDRDLGAGWLVFEGATVALRMAGVIALAEAFQQLRGEEDRGAGG